MEILRCHSQNQSALTNSPRQATSRKCSVHSWPVLYRHRPATLGARTSQTRWSQCQETCSCSGCSKVGCFAPSLMGGSEPVRTDSIFSRASGCLIVAERHRVQATAGQVRAYGPTPREADLQIAAPLRSRNPMCTGHYLATRVRMEEG